MAQGFPKNEPKLLGNSNQLKPDLKSNPIAKNSNTPLSKALR